MTTGRSDQIRIDITREQASAVTDVLVSRLAQLRQRIEGAKRDERIEEFRARMSALGGMMNSLNGAMETDEETGLKMFVHDVEPMERRRLKEEMAGLYTLSRPDDAAASFDRTVEDSVVGLAGWVHRLDAGELEPSVFFSKPESAD